MVKEIDSLDEGRRDIFPLKGLLDNDIFEDLSFKYPANTVCGGFNCCSSLAIVHQSDFSKSYTSIDLFSKGNFALKVRVLRWCAFLVYYDLNRALVKNKVFISMIMFFYLLHTRFIRP